jgi:hypothetical protein
MCLYSDCVVCLCLALAGNDGVDMFCFDRNGFVCYVFGLDCTSVLIIMFIMCFVLFVMCFVVIVLFCVFSTCWQRQRGPADQVQPGAAGLVRLRQPALGGRHHALQVRHG